MKATMERREGHVFLTLDHDKGRSCYVLAGPIWTPLDPESAGAMRDLTNDLKEGEQHESP